MSTAYDFLRTLKFIIMSLSLITQRSKQHPFLIQGNFINMHNAVKLCFTLYIYQQCSLVFCAYIRGRKNVSAILSNRIIN